MLVEVEVLGFLFVVELIFIEFNIFYVFLCIFFKVFMCVELLEGVVVISDLLNCVVDMYVYNICKKFEYYGIMGVLVMVCGVGYWF